MTLLGHLARAKFSYYDTVGSHKSAKRFRNIVGANIAKARLAKEMSQDTLAAKLQLLGLDNIDRFGISKIEHHVRSVYDYELQMIAQVLSVTVESLYPKPSETKSALEELKVGYRKD